jgi:gas vesicle protein
MFSKKQKFPYLKVGIGVAVGAITGAALALLFAPVTGRKMQKKVANVTENLIDKMGETVDDVQTAVRRLARA